MHLYIATILGIISVTTALKCNIKCNRMLAPVCGHDGKTYSNECIARYSSCKVRQPITIVAKTGCKKIGVTLAGPLACTSDYRPVCGSDGKTYANKCMLISAIATSRKAISVIQESACDDVGDNCFLKCTREMKPICGSDRKKHANECQMRSVACATKKAIIAVSKGSRTSCKTCRIPCSRVYKPVCGSDGVTYGNECALRRAACTNGAIIKINEGECKFNRECKIACPRALSPVCGSDGKKYNNECLLKVAACKQGKAIMVVQERAFDADCSKCDFACTREYNPVCGSDGKTHSTECVMRGLACQSGKAINKVYDGECK